MSPRAMDGKAEARADLLEKVVAYGCARLAEPTSTSFARFAPSYYAHVASEDAGARSVADLYGAALAHLRLAERRVPGHASRADLHADVRRARLRVDAQRAADRHRRHAVPRRLGEHGARPPRRRHPPRDPPDHPRCAVPPTGRCSRSSTTESDDTASDGVIAEAFMHFEIDRETDRAILDDLASDVRRVLDDVRRRCRRLGRDARPIDCHRRRPRHRTTSGARTPRWQRLRRSFAGWPTTTSPISGTASTS